MASRYSRRPRRGGALYDTPTDGISKKVFDRYKDQQVIKYVRLAQRIEDLQRRMRSITSGEEE